MTDNIVGWTSSSFIPLETMTEYSEHYQLCTAHISGLAQYGGSVFKQICFVWHHLVIPGSLLALIQDYL